MTIINNALAGALAAQAALSASSQNIANMQTPGYTRQAALLTSVGPEGTPRSAGNGVQVSSLIRFSDGYKSQQLWHAGTNVGQYSQTQPYLTQLESVMGDSASSLSGGIDTFFQSLNAVAGDDPTSTPLRQQVLTSAGLMAQHFNSLNNVFNTQLQSIGEQRSALVDAANADSATIATLNQKISQANAAGQSASSLIDSRDQAIDDLAGKVGLEVSDQPDGTRDVSLKSGQSLVIGGVAGKLAVTGGQAASQAFSVAFATTTSTLDATALGGQLGGLSSYVNGTLLPLQQGVSDIAQQLAAKVNTQLQAGYTMSGAAGQALFVFNPGSGANMLQVAAGFQSADLAFSSDGTPGDSGNLQQVIALKDTPITVTTLGSVQLSDADTQLVGKLGVESQQNQASLDTAQTVRNQASDDWQSTSGVNQDEEATNLVAYQQMYQANMKVIAVADTLFDATLQMMG